MHRGAKRGAFHINPSTVANVIERYVRKAEIRTADGKLALDVHPHLFRHHVGTSMVNENIPLTVIQDVLDHGSIEMTARYARMREETVKQAVKRWHERVNIRGERIALPVDGPLEQAAWMKERIARAKQALPNGYCGLPLVQSCPHPNACLSCESFLTDGSFRAVHEQQQAETRRLLEKARKNNNVRLVEMLERDEQSLARILEGLDQIEADHADGPRGARPARPRRRARSRAPDGRRAGPSPARRCRRQADARRGAARPRRAARARSPRRGDHVRRASPQRARVSRAFLYQHAELRAEIEALRAAQAVGSGAAAGPPARQRRVAARPAARGA